VSPDWIERAVVQIGIDRLPVAGIIRKRAVLDLAVFKVALVDLGITMAVSVLMSVMTERENRELRQANEILRKASAYFAIAELDRPFKR
jgi:hypothetical protein